MEGLAEEDTPAAAEHGGTTICNGNTAPASAVGTWKSSKPLQKQNRVCHSQQYLLLLPDNFRTNVINCGECFRYGPGFCCHTTRTDRREGAILHP